MTTLEDRVKQRYEYLRQFGGLVPGVSDEVDGEKPPQWFDQAKFQRAQKLANKYYAR